MNVESGREKEAVEKEMGRKMKIQEIVKTIVRQIEDWDTAIILKK